MKRPEGFDAPSKTTRPATPRAPREPSRGSGGRGASASQPPAAPRKHTTRTDAEPPAPPAVDPSGERKPEPRTNASRIAESRPARAGTTDTPARGTRTARKPHPPAPRGSRAPLPGSEPQPLDDAAGATKDWRRLVPHRRLSADAEARRAARQRRRFERGEIRRFTRRSRNRRLAWMAALLLVVGMFGGVAAAVFSPLFALQRIELRGADRVDADEVHAALERQLGTPLALLDEGAIRDRLGGFPLIRSFVTELVPPDTLVIRITEREPVGAIPSDAGFDLPDPAGVVVQSVQERPDGMPLIDVGDEGVPSTAFRSAAEVLLALPADLAARVDTVTARTKDDVTLVLSGSDQRVLWGSAEQSVAKARALAGLVAQHGASGPGQYDVSAPQTVVFRAD